MFWSLKQYTKSRKRGHNKMKVQITGKNITITEAMRKQTEAKLQKMDKYFIIDENVTTKVLARTYRNEQKIEITIYTKMMDFRVEVKGSDYYNVLDEAIDKLEGQMRKLKTKISKKHQESLLENINFSSFDGIDDDENEEIVRVKEISLTPTDMESAILKMEALGHKFYIYLDEEDNLVSVVYKRDDGGYGVIQVK